ncbi:hypothetical protein K1X84_12475 [bacterium]|nr:hypothetical protein [bacterium]
MKSVFSYLLVFIFIGGAIAIIPMERLFDELVNSDKLIENVRHARLYEQLLKIVSDNLTKNSSLARLKNTPLELTETEIQEVLKQTFPEDWFINNLQASHRMLLNHLDGKVQGNGIRLGFLITDKKDLLIENFSGIFSTKFSSLPACSEKDLIKLGMALYTSNQDVKALIPDCRPPQKIEQAILQSIHQSVSETIDQLPDTVDFLNPKLLKNADIKIETSIHNLAALRNISNNFGTPAYFVLCIILILIALINWNNKKHMLFRIGVPILVSGLIVCLLFGLGYMALQGKPGKIEKTIHIDSVNVDTIQLSEGVTDLVLSFGKSLMVNYFTNALIFSIIVTSFGIFIMIASNFVGTPAGKTVDSP